MDIYDRLKYLRKEVLGMSQEEFAATINISRSNLGNIEIKKINITERILTDICDKHNVNKEWLKTGEGEMFAKKSTEDIFIEYMPKILAMEDGDFAKEFITILMQLEPEHWKLIEDFARKVIEKTDKAKKEDTN